MARGTLKSYVRQLVIASVIRQTQIIQWLLQFITSFIRQHNSAVYVGMLVVVCILYYTLSAVCLVLSILPSKRSQRSVLHFKLIRLTNGTYQFGNHSFLTVKQLQHHFENEQPSIGGDIGSVVTPEYKRGCAVHLFVLLPLVFMYMWGEGGEGWRRQCVWERESSVGIWEWSKFGRQGRGRGLGVVDWCRHQAYVHAYSTGNHLFSTHNYCITQHVNSSINIDAPMSLYSMICK